DRVASFLEGGAAVRREERHAERMREEREHDEAQGAARASPRQDACGDERNRKKPVSRREPDDPFRKERQRPSDPRERRGLADTSEPADETPLDFRGRGRRIRRAGGREAEENCRRHHHGRHDGENGHSAERERARRGEKRDEQQRFRERKRRQRYVDGRRERAYVRVSMERGGYQTGGQRELHGGPGSPEHWFCPWQRDLS